MTYRELTVIQVREVLRRWQAGQGTREIARDACVDRKTVRRYVAAARERDMPHDRALTDDEVNAIAQRCRHARFRHPANSELHWSFIASASSDGRRRTSPFA